jgi:hypothetical protein
LKKDVFDRINRISPDGDQRHLMFSGSLRLGLELVIGVPVLS